MDYLDRFTREYIVEKFQRPSEYIKDALDMYILFNMHNIYPDEKCEVYEDRIEVFSVIDYRTNEKYEYFIKNKVVIYLPYSNTRGTGILEVQFIDKNDEIDVLQRKKVKRHLKESLSGTINIDRIIFNLSK